MRIAFDGTTLRPARTGVGCYSERLLRHLADEGADDEFVVVSNRRADIGSLPAANVRPFEGRRRLVSMAWLQLLAPGVLRTVGADVAHFTNGVMPFASRVPSVVTIHDMSLTLYPRYHPLRRVLLHRPLVDLTARRASAIITHSNASKQDIVRLYGLDPARVHVVHLAPAPEFVPISDTSALSEVRRRYGLPDRFILYVGTIEPRKNLPRLLDAFADRYRSGDLTCHLVCAGPYGWRSRDVARRVASLDVASAVHFLGYVPFADLPALYNLSSLFVFPSLYEGFGLPVVEAMACGVAVLIGRSASLVEITGDAVESVDPLDTHALGRALATLTNDDARRKDLAARGLVQARQFSWERAAKETLRVYRAAVAAQTVERPLHASVASPAVRPGSLGGPGSEVALSETSGRVLFGQAYYLRFDPKLWAARQPYPPLGTLYAAAHLRQHGYRVALFDAMLADSEADWAAALDRERPAFAVLYEDNFNYLSKMCLLRMRAAALQMIAHARARHIPVIVAGSDATDHPAIYLDAGARCVLIGEGEVTLKEVVDALTGVGARSLEEIPGVCLLGADGGVRHAPPREPIRDLESLPRPAWDLVDMARYRAIWRSRHAIHSMNLVTTRGCPYHCNWCAKPIYGQRYTVRRPDAVVDEIAWLKETYRPDHLWVADDIFGLQPGWIERFAELVVAREAVVPFKCLMRADGVTPSVVKALRAAGCRTVWIGAESGSQRILDAMDKGVKVPQITAAAGHLHAAGIQVGLFLQFGYPGETREDIERTLQMVRSCRPDDIGVSVSYPLPGTRFYDRVRAELGDKRNWIDSSDLSTMYHATYGPEFYRVLHQTIHAEFRLRKALRSLRLRQAGSALINGLRLPLLRWQLDQFSRGPMTRPAVSVSTGRS
jgi:anaerobic magnesium-protoporphyrin IX monomethyl ester cyclase